MFTMQNAPIDQVCYVYWLGSGVQYAYGQQIQRKIHDLRSKGLFQDSLLMMEHDHVYTLGRRSPREHILADQMGVKRLGISLVETDRGGLVTYHGPGQLIGYPIIDLKRLGVGPKLYVRRLEEALIAALGKFDIVGQQVNGLTGVWVGEAKIGAIGVKISGGITTHGFSLNVNTDISYYDHIIPCGIKGVEITSMSALAGRPLDLQDVRKQVALSFAECWGFVSYELTEFEFQDALTQVGH
mgnify:CR=1 FL=1